MMGMNYFANPVVFLIDTLFGLYILAVLLRFLFQLFRADFNNPISRFLIKITHQPLRIFRRVIPSVGQTDFASIVFMFVLQLVAGLLIFTLQGVGFNPFSLIFWSLAELLSLAINVFVFAIIVQVVMSWITPGQYNHVTALIYSLTEPLLQPVRRFLPDMGGLDLSPLAVLIGLQFLKMMLLPPLYHMAGIAFY